MTGKGKTTLENHLKEWQEIPSRVRTQMLFLAEVQKSARRAIKPMLEAQNSFQRALEPILRQQEQWRKIADAIPRFNFPDLSRVTRQAAEFQKSISNFLAPTFSELQKTFRELPVRMREAILQLADYGWFFDLDMSLPELWNLKNSLEVGNVKEAEDALMEYFEKRLKAIEKSIVEKFPKRSHLIRIAFKAHRRQEYELSIPVFLSQVDGICKERFGQNFFLKKDKKPRTAIYVEKIKTDIFIATLLIPLAQPLPISFSESERGLKENSFNRHMILHGESLDYGNKINGSKAISLLNYVSRVVVEGGDI